MNTLDWLDAIALDIVDIESELRTALRTLSRTGPITSTPGHHTTPAARYGRRITIADAEARTILRGLVPVPVATRPLRHQHLRMGVTLNNLLGHLVALNNPMHNIDAALEAASRATDELREWQRQARWAQATKQAGVKGWVCPPQLPITGIMRRPTPPKPEHDVNLPSAEAARRHRRETSLGWLQERQAAFQLTLPLPPPQPAEVVDIRQIALPFAAAA